MPTTLPVPSRAWLGVLAVLAAVVGGWPLLPPGAAAAAVLVVAAAAAAALLLGRAHGTTRRLWRTLGVAQTLVALGWACWLLLPGGTGGAALLPDAGDAFFLGAYAVQVVVVAGLSRASGADRSSVLDAAVLGTSTGVVMWALVVGPAADADAVPLAARLVTLAYPMLDVLLLAAAVPLVLSRTRTTRSLLLLGGVLAQLAGDVVHARLVAAGAPTGVTSAAVLFVLSSGLLAAAALHPSPTGAAGRARWWRRAVLGAAVLPLPGLLVVRVVQGSADDVPLIGAATLVLTGLVVVRTVGGDGGLSAAAEHAVRRTVLRFGVCLLAFAILPLVSLTALGVGQARSAVEGEVERRLQATATTGAAHVEDRLRSLSDLVASYADRPSVVDAVASPGPASAAVLSRHLLELQGRGDDYVGAWLLDADGVLRTFAPAQPSVVGGDFSARDYFTGVVRERGPYVSEAFATALPGAPQVVALAAPVQRNGALLGVVVLGYRLEAVDALAAGIGGAQGTLLTLTDRRGTVLSGRTRRPDRLVSVADAPGVAAALAGRSGFEVPEHRDSGTWRAYAPLPTTGGALVAEAPAATAYAPVHRLTGRMVAAATLLGQVLLAGLVLQAQVERRRRGAEALLASREGQVREILAAAGDAFLTFDSSGRVLRWNRAAEEVFGRGADDALGRSVLDLCVPLQDRAVRADQLRRAVAAGGGGGSAVSLDACRADGTVFPAEGTLWSTVVDGRLTFNAFARDVTERREQEDALAAARDEAVRSSRIKSEFVANMSHEIRTPMNGVVGMTSLLLDTPLDDRQRAYVQTLRGSADALLTVINDVLDFSKIEAGKLDVEVADFAVTTLVEDVVELLSGAARAKGLQIAAVVDPSLPDALQGDAHRLRQVLTNLVGNAVKFTERGEVVLTVRAEGPEVDGLLPLLLSVRDTGEGIAADRQQQLFEAFTQADASTTRKHGGTGLGLTISRQLVELMGGSLGVESELGVGSTFTVRLGLAEGHSPAGAPAVDLSGVRVLVADGSAAHRTVLIHLLERWSAEVTVVPDGVEALVALREQARAGRPYGLALLDARMPGIDGVAVAAAVAADSGLHGMPVVLLSASDGPDGAGAPGVSAHLGKPVRARHLHRALLERVPGAASAAAPRLPRPRAATRGRVLVAEDNAVNQVVAVELLGKLGFAADVAGNGAEAVALLQRGDYDAVLMDCQMPVVDGYAATGRIRALPTAKAGTPVVALTASALTTDRDACFAAGMDDFLAKPLRVEDLEQALRRAVPAAWAAPGGDRRSEAVPSA